MQVIMFRHMHLLRIKLLIWFTRLQHKHLFLMLKLFVMVVLLEEILILICQIHLIFGMINQLKVIKLLI